VAEILNLSVKTVDNQLATALRKIGNAINIDLRKAIRF
jgi:DNA-binding CsgD family transcriptional regulator